MKNYYDELEVSKTSSKEVINKVYKILAKKYHPDTTTEADKHAAEEKFKAISEAYEILSDDEKRKKYDLELESQTPTVSYDEYLNVINERDSLNITLNNLKKEFNQFKSSINYRNPNNNNNNSSNHMNSNLYNTNNIQTYNNPPKSKYYNVTTGKPVSAFTYYKYKIKQFFSNLLLIILSIIVGILILNTFSNSNIFDSFNLFLK